jgi:hypothetical protein
MNQAKIAFFNTRRVSLLVCAMTAIFAPSSGLAATMRFDGGGGDGLWETAANWDAAGSPDTLPGAADVAEITGNYTVNVSSAQTITELQMAFPNSSAATVGGATTLNILPGTNIQNNGTAGIRVGRLLKGGELLGSSKGSVYQTGGLVQINAGTQGLRLSAGDSGNVADSYYRISGGALRTVGASNAIQVGNLASNYISSEFHVYGSGATEIRTDDFRIQDSPTGTTRLHLSLDAGGITPITADDEFQFRGTNNNELVVDLIGLAPMTDILVTTADRLGNNSGAVENFFGLPDGAAISASIGPPRQMYTYNWTIDYQDGLDDGIKEAYIYLRFVSRTLSVPEPSSLAFIAFGGLALLTKRRRDS